MMPSYTKIAIVKRSPVVSFHSGGCATSTTRPALTISGNERIMSDIGALGIAVLVALGVVVITRVT